MNFIKRFGLMIVINLLVMVTVSILLNIFNVRPYLEHNGINYQQLMIFCLIWGFGGAFVSLLMSKFMAKKMMGVQVIDPNGRSSQTEQWLLQTVHTLARNAGLNKMPEVGIYESPDMNAFATGPSRRNSLVAVSTGLLNKMDQNEVEGVLAHEVAHIANGDMVTMVLIQGIVNAFGMFLSRVIASVIMRSDDDRKSNSGMQFMLTMVLDMVFSFLGMFVIAYFSRVREFRADAGGALYGGREKMIQALQKLQKETSAPAVENNAMATLQISDRRSRMMALLSTHPKLEDRIAKLKAG